jgi:hypothetical protein
MMRIRKDFFEHEHTSIASLSLPGQREVTGVKGLSCMCRVSRCSRIKPAIHYYLCLLVLMPLQHIFAESSICYVDSLRGNDMRSGYSPNTAGRSIDKVSRTVFHPGDKILFKSGSHWYGELALHGSGKPSHPITIDTYGDGPRPEISGDGGGATVLLRNTQYWEIHRLSLSNAASATGIRDGVLVETDMPGEVVHHVLLEDLSIHNVIGRVGADIASKNTGGIGFFAAGKERPARFDDIAVLHCTIENVDATGIWLYSESPAHPRDAFWASAYHTHVHLDGNTIAGAGKNSIIVRLSEAPLIENNVISNSAARFHGNAIVVFSSKDAVIRRNIVSGTTFYGNEGAAYDSDYNSLGTVIEYNISHDNGGGLVDLCSNPKAGEGRGYNDGTIVRYNISQNDKYRVFGFDGPVTNTLIYNNSVYIGAVLSPLIVDFDLFGNSPGYPRTTAFVNNVIVNGGNGGYKWSGGQDYTFEANCFLGVHPPNGPVDRKGIFSGAGFISAPVTDASVDGFLAGYSLRAGSGCRLSGVSLEHNGGHDIAGRPLPSTALDRGAIQSSGSIL